MDIDWTSISSLKYYGFKGAWPVTDFRGFIDNGTLNQRVPAESGVYVVFCMADSQPSFIKIGTGGLYKGKDPNVNITMLEDKWVAGAPVIYIGRTKCLQKRIRQLIEFGRGKAVGHWGGRIMWQLDDASSLRVCWMVSDDYEKVRDSLLQSFCSQLGRLPFANLGKR